jgi:peptidyl-prolyl cis-trans isomerase A (cyclophilin A)
MAYPVASLKGFPPFPCIPPPDAVCYGSPTRRLCGGTIELEGTILMKRFLLVMLAACFLVSPSCAAEKNPVVVMETSLGTIKIELDPDKAPITVKNFLDYVDAKFYDGTIFHRVIPTFMIQGGGFEPAFSKAKEVKEATAAEKKTREPIKNEGRNGLSNVRGTIAMARTNNPDSATAQFFINVKDNSATLDPNARSAGYAVFGKVIEGMDVVDKIKKVETKVLIPDIFEDVPVENVVIKSVRRAEK